MPGKYNNQKTEVDGHVFDSRREAERYIELKNDPTVAELTLQPKFLLQESFYKNNHKYREINYISDFDILYKDGRREVEDVKGFVTEVFKIKMKLADYKYPDINFVVS